LGIVDMKRQGGFPLPQQGDESIGANPGEFHEIAQRLQQPWDVQARLNAIRGKVDEYARPHGGIEVLLASKNPTRRNDPAMDIINKLVDEGEQRHYLQDSERATIEVLRSGMREFIDYSLAEVGRHGQRINASTTFDWATQGQATDAPALFRSQRENWVGRRSPPDRQLRQFEATHLPQFSPADPREERFSVV